MNTVAARVQCRTASSHGLVVARPASLLAVRGRPPSQYRHTFVSSPSSDRRMPVKDVSCQGLFGLGVPEIAVIAGVVALIYGPSKLPELGKGLGKTAKSFQTAAKEFEKELKEEMKEDDEEEDKKTTTGQQQQEQKK
ncbi:Sec-independent protein translocase protein TATA [Picochlorum sp. SENEW3]|nr:Sec-independent protein translocase protein TATA [Picochlorum sp. SENEW3]